MFSEWLLSSFHSHSKNCNVREGKRLFVAMWLWDELATCAFAPVTAGRGSGPTDAPPPELKNRAGF